MSAGVRVEGFAELEESFKAMAEAVPEILEEEVGAAAGQVGAAMRARAERHRLTGRTVEDIQAEPVADRAAGEARFEIGASGGKGGRAFVLNMLEFGTTKMAARPIVRPTADEDMPAIVDKMNQRIEDRVTKAGGL